MLEGAKGLGMYDLRFTVYEPKEGRRFRARWTLRGRGAVPLGAAIEELIGGLGGRPRCAWIRPGLSLRAGWASSEFGRETSLGRRISILGFHTP